MGSGESESRTQAQPRRLGCLEPLSPIGLGRGQFEFCALPHPWFLTTGEVALLSLASMAWARVTHSVSSLTGMIE